MKATYRILTTILIWGITMSQLLAQQNTDIYRTLKISNGQTVLLSYLPTAKTVHAEVYFRIGTIYEFDSVSGISLAISKIISSRINHTLAKEKGRHIKYYGTVVPELVGFHFDCDESDLDYVLALANEKIMNPKFDDESAEEAKAEMQADLDSMNNIGSYLAQEEINKLIWQKDYKKLTVFGDKVTYTKLTANELNAFHHKYFLPLNNTLVFMGNILEKSIMDKVQATFKEFTSREFNPELITRVLEFKPVINYTQLLSASADNEVNTATVSYQNPGARQDRKSSFCAFLLANLINDKSSAVQQTIQKAGLKNLRATYYCENYYGVMKLSMESSENNFNDMFEGINKVVQDFVKKEYFKEGEIERAVKNMEIELKDFRDNHPMEYMNEVMHYRFFNDENYINAFADSLNHVSVADMRRYVGDYYIDHTGIRFLYTSANAMRNAPTEQQYFPLDESIANLKFAYELNKTDIESDTAKRDLQRLIQWLKINPDMHVQINGFADEGEYKKTQDTTIMRFIDATPTFHKAMPDAIKLGYLRIEMMRAMKIAKAIYEAGIGEDRISGTSMIFTSDSKEQAAENRKCTVTIEKIKPRLSLYEYHFGKKKPANE